jgi:hypothetical protein
MCGPLDYASALEAMSLAVEFSCHNHTERFLASLHAMYTCILANPRKTHRDYAKMLMVRDLIIFHSACTHSYILCMHMYTLFATTVVLANDIF